MKLRYERGALADLAEIFAHIAEDNRTAAARLVNRIENIARRIAANPNGRGCHTQAELSAISGWQIFDRV
jgi:plasmid stabilization system protein ParE